EAGCRGSTAGYFSFGSLPVKVRFRPCGRLCVGGWLVARCCFPRFPLLEPRSQLLLERHHELDGVERVRPQVIDERRLVLDLGFVDSELLGDDLLDALFDVFHARLLPVGAMLCVGQEGLVFYDITMPPLTCSTAPVT